ncbi:MAG: leucine-rich repeat domain-containing protein, partial [Lachnospiraceae bacterium]|nr:leucine-rich repeat domain-containing protein [Lachnospiraceae bacterium]
MKNEYITTGAEYGSVTELQHPREDMGTSKEYFEPPTEYWENVSEFSNEMMKPPADDGLKKAAAARQKKHTKLLKKVVYGIASAATVFTMAQTITPAWDIKEPVQQEQMVQEEVLIDREHQTIQPVDKPVQEALWPANIIRISCDGELTKEVVEEELTKYDLSEPFGIVLEGNITRIGKRALAEYKNLVQIQWPDSVKEIGESAFYACKQLVIERLDTAGLTVGNNAFSYSTIEELIVSGSFEAEYTEPFEWANVKTVSYEPGLTRMPAFILNGVFTLETLEVPAGVTEIGQRAIGNCRDLREVTLPEGLTLLGKNAFYDCDKLTRVNLPGSLKTIGEQAFYECNQLVFEQLDTAGLLVGNNAFSYSTIEELIVSGSFEAEYTEPFE